MVPHKSQKYHAILDLSFALDLFGMKIPSVNESTVTISHHHSMSQLMCVLPQLIEALAATPLDGSDTGHPLDHSSISTIPPTCQM